MPTPLKPGRELPFLYDGKLPLFPLFVIFQERRNLGTIGIEQGNSLGCVTILRIKGVDVQVVRAICSFKPIQPNAQMPPLHPGRHAPVPPLRIVRAERMKSMPGLAGDRIKLGAEHLRNGAARKKNTGMGFDHNSPKKLVTGDFLYLSGNYISQ